MKKLVIINYGVCKRPADATPERALDLYKQGWSMAQIGRLWDVTRQRVWMLIQKAKQQ